MKTKFRAKRGTMQTIPKRIAKSLDEVIKETAEKNNLTLVQASDELAKMFRLNLKGKNIMEEIRF